MSALTLTDVDGIIDCINEAITSKTKPMCVKIYYTLYIYKLHTVVMPKANDILDAVYEMALCCHVD